MTKQLRKLLTPKGVRGFLHNLHNVFVWLDLRGGGRITRFE